MRVLLHPSIPFLCEAEDLLDDQEWMFDLRLDSRLRRVFRPFDFIDFSLTPSAAVEVPAI